MTDTWPNWWPERYLACKGTDRETACLLSIAAEAEKSHPELHALAKAAAELTGEDREYALPDLEYMLAVMARREAVYAWEEVDLSPRSVRRQREAEWVQAIADRFEELGA